MNDLTIRIIFLTFMGALFLSSAFFFLAGRPLSSHTDSRSGRITENMIGGWGLFLGLDYMLWVVQAYLIMKGCAQPYVTTILHYVDFMSYPLVFLMVDTLVTRKKPQLWHFALIGIPTLLLCIADLLSEAQWIFIAADIVVFCIIIGLTVYFTIVFRKRNEHLKMVYSNIDGKDINWFGWVQLLLYSCTLIATFSSIWGQYGYIYYITEIICALLIFYYAMHMKYNDAEDELLNSAELDTETETNNSETPQAEHDAYKRIAAGLAKQREQRFFLNPNVSVQQLANAISTNRTYLSRYLNHVEHATFYQYVNRLRAEYACRMLEQQSNLDSPAQIWMECGFGSEATFRKFFSDTYGCTPTQYYRRQRKA